MPPRRDGQCVQVVAEEPIHLQDNPHVQRFLTEMLQVVLPVLVDNIVLNLVLVAILMEHRVQLVVTHVHREHIVMECMAIYAVLVAILLVDRHLVRFALLDMHVLLLHRLQ